MKIVITGANGRIGRNLRRELKDRHNLVLLDLHSNGDLEVKSIDLGYSDRWLVDIFKGADTVVHLAANPDNWRPWAELEHSNLDATNNVFLAAQSAGVKRVVFASSLHAMDGYRHDKLLKAHSIKPDSPPRPGSYFLRDGRPANSIPYGAMKLAAEATGKAMAVFSSLVFVSIRIGWVIDDENQPESAAQDHNWRRWKWVSNPDLNQLFRLSIEKPMEPGTSVVLHGVSNNEGQPWCLQSTREFGYQPQDGLSAEGRCRGVMCRGCGCGQEEMEDEPSSRKCPSDNDDSGIVRIAFGT